MKTIILPTISVLLMITSCAKIKVEMPDSTISTASGDRTQKTYNYSFDQLKVSTGITADIIKAENEKIVIEAPEKLMDKVKVVQKDGLVSILIESNGIFKNISADGNVHATIYAKDFSAVTAESAADITVRDKFLQEKMAVDVSSSGSVSGHLEANEFRIKAASAAEFTGQIWALNLEADLSSGATVSTKGKVTNANVSVSSGSSFEGSNTSLQEADLDASSGGSVVAGVVKRVTARASSGGSIQIRKQAADTEVNLKESSGGSVSVSGD